jgi:hypothetical protein
MSPFGALLLLATLCGIGKAELVAGQAATYHYHSRQTSTSETEASRVVHSVEFEVEAVGQTEHETFLDLRVTKGTFSDYINPDDLDLAHSIVCEVNTSTLNTFMLPFFDLSGHVFASDHQLNSNMMAVASTSTLAMP